MDSRTGYAGNGKDGPGAAAFRVQDQIRRNAQDMQEYLTDLGSWEKKMKKKDKCGLAGACFMFEGGLVKETVNLTLFWILSATGLFVHLDTTAASCCLLTPREVSRFSKLGGYA